VLVGLRVEGLGSRVQGLWCRESVGSRVEGFSLRVGTFSVLLTDKPRHLLAHTSMLWPRFMVQDFTKPGILGLAHPVPGGALHFSEPLGVLGLVPRTAHAPHVPSGEA